MSLRLGKKPARKGAVSFALAKYGATLKAAPATHLGSLKSISNWQGMMDNDKLGDCVCAEAGHGTIYLNYMGGAHVTIPAKAVVDMYSAVTGYDPMDPNTDQGTDMQEAASYRRKTGIADSLGKRHKIAAYLDLGASNRDQLKKAIYYFGYAGLGFNFPNSAMDQFNAGEPWTVVKGEAKPTDGHDVAAAAYDATYIYVVTWGKVQKMAWAFFDKYSDEALAYLSTEMLKAGKSPEGLNATQLTADLKALK